MLQNSVVDIYRVLKNKVYNVSGMIEEVLSVLSTFAFTIHSRATAYLQC